RPDATPPTTPEVTDEGLWTPNRASLTASWTADDPESGIKRFEYRLIESGGTVVRDWTPTGLETQVEVVGLTLAIGKTYIFEVRAINPGDLISPVGTSDGITVFTYDVVENNRVDAADTDAFRQC